jgi:hypothetical protein
MAMVRKDIDDDDSASSSGSNKLEGAGAAAGGSRSSFDIATATSWPDVKAADVLVAPHEARLAWREFMHASSLSVQQVRCKGCRMAGSLVVEADGWCCQVSSQGRSPALLQSVLLPAAC